MNNEHDYERSSLQPLSVVSSGGACGSLLPGLMNVGPRTTVHANLQQTLDPGTVDPPNRRGDADNVLIGLRTSAPAPTAQASHDAAAMPRHHARHHADRGNTTPSAASVRISEFIAAADATRNVRPAGRSPSIKAPLALDSRASARGSSLLAPALPVQDATGDAHADADAQSSDLTPPPSRSRFSTVLSKLLTKLCPRAASASPATETPLVPRPSTTLLSEQLTQVQSPPPKCTAQLSNHTPEHAWAHLGPGYDTEWPLSDSGTGTVLLYSPTRSRPTTPPSLHIDPALLEHTLRRLPRPEDYYFQPLMQPGLNGGWSDRTALDGCAIHRSKAGPVHLVIGRIHRPRPTVASVPPPSDRGTTPPGRTSSITCEAARDQERSTTPPLYDSIRLPIQDRLFSYAARNGLLPPPHPTLAKHQRSLTPGSYDPLFESQPGEIDINHPTIVL